MIETNPYRLEEAEWTPGNVYDIIPPGALSHTGFEYSEGSDNIDEGEVRNSLVSGVADFFGQLLGGIGKILGGAVELGVGILGGIVDGISNFIGEIASAIGGLIPDGARATPIKDAVVAVMEPMRSQIFDLGANLTALSDETKLRIDEQKDLIDDANVAIGEAKNLTAAVKKVADQNKKDVASAISKADTANASLAELTPKITAATNTANKAASDIANLTPKVTAAQNRADSAYTEAGKVRSEVTPKIEAAQSRGDNAMTEAEKAVGWLKNPVEIGSSLIALDVETKEPHYMQWAGTPTTPSTSGLPFTRAVRVNSSTETRRDAPAEARVPVKVSPDITYKWSVWVYSNKAKTEIGFLVTSDSIGSCVEETTYKTDGRTSTSEEGIFVKDIPTGWSRHEGTVKFKQATDNVSLYAVEWNRSEAASAQQWFAALDIAPDVPTQASVDEAQNEALRAHSEILRQQDEINEAQRVANLAQKNFNDNQTKWNQAVDRSIATQKTVNDNFEKWTDGATTAIQANTSAIKALGKIDTGESLIAYLTPTDEEVRAGTAKYDVPVWTTGAHRAFSGQNQPPEYVKHAFGASSTDSTRTAKTVPVAVRPGTKYILSFWAYGSGDLVIYLYGNGGGYPILSTRQLKVNQETLRIEKDEGGRRIYDPAKNGNSTNSTGTQWLLNGFKPDNLYEWTHYKFEVEFTEPTTEVWFNQFYWNWRETSVYGQYLADMQFYPDVPTQADVDEAQNKAIEANTETIKHQIEINNLFQEQLWTQLDMIEQGEIQRPRVYHQFAEDGNLTSNIPSWVGWSSAREYLNTFINFYHRYKDTKTIYWQATGSWEGQVRLTTNWDNGSMDTWVYTIHKDRITRGKNTYSGRTMSNGGGAPLIYHRNTTFEVYPKNLGREVEVSIPTAGGRWWLSEPTDYSEQPSLIRHHTSDELRLTASTTCTRAIATRVYQDGEWVKKVYDQGEVIPPSMLWREDMPTGTTYFRETNFLGVDW